jgi:hypothetical protein|nr:MAG TPA: hypothetical protein [Caudoviricetes sp.]
MKIIVTKKFLDISLDREVEAGEILEISPERYEEMQINAAALDDVYFKAIDTAHTTDEVLTATFAAESEGKITDTVAEKSTDAVAEEPEKKAKGRGKKSSK